MRWAANDEKFFTPRFAGLFRFWMTQRTSCQIVETKSSKFSRGHRFTQNVNVEINNVDEYVEKLKKAHVIVNQTKERL